MAYTTRQHRCPLGEIETWIFDLDNTLYPASCRLFEQVQRRMNEYICERLEVTPDDVTGAAFDPHAMSPGAVLSGVRRLGGTPPPTYVVGCRAGSVAEGVKARLEV